MSTLIIGEFFKRLDPSTRALVKAAHAFAKPITLVIIGFQALKIAEEAAKIKSVTTVYWLETSEHTTAEIYADVIASMAIDYEVVLAPATTFGKNILPKVAAKLDMTMLSEVNHIINADTFEHLTYAGNVVETVKILDKIKLLAIRLTAFSAVNGNQIPCCILLYTWNNIPAKVRVIKQKLTVLTRPDLNQAKIVVAGGRGLESAEHFELINQLADVLGAAVGASRAAVDAGFISNDFQIGQTGKSIAPDLYIAIGISGAVQHLSGIKEAKVIVAINKDPEAPIFQVAHYGMVGDLFELIPRLIKSFEAVKK